MSDTCQICRYPLRGHARDAACPECGGTVRVSHVCNVDLTRFGHGLVLIGLSMAAHVLLSAFARIDLMLLDGGPLTAPVISMNEHHVVLWRLKDVALIVGVVVVTRRIEGLPPRPRLARLAGLAVVLAVLIVSMFEAFSPRTSQSADLNAHALALALFGVGLAATVLAIGGVAGDLGRPRVEVAALFVAAVALGWGCLPAAFALFGGLAIMWPASTAYTEFLSMGEWLAWLAPSLSIALLLASAAAVMTFRRIFRVHCADVAATF